MVMDPQIENSIRQEQIESLGRLIAGFSHDMKNHLGVIRESSGLMGDLLSMGGIDTNEVQQNRLQKSIATIEKRVVTAAEMLHHLSGLAHRSDAPLSSFQLNDLIVEESIFLKRFANMGQIDFTLKLQEGLPFIYNDPSLLQHVIYRLYRGCLDTIEAGGRLQISTISCDDSITMTFQAEGSAKSESVESISQSTLSAIKKLHGDFSSTMSANGLETFQLKITSVEERK